MIITGLAPDGAQNMLLKILKNIDRERFSPSVVSLTNMGDVGPKIEALGIPVFAMGFDPRLPSPLKFWRLTKLLKRVDPDVVHTWMYHADLLGGLAARIAGVRALSWGIRRSDLSKEHNKRVTLMVVKLCAALSGRVPNKILCCSAKACASHIAAGFRADKMEVLPNGFEVSHFKPDPDARISVRDELGLPVGTTLIGLVGRNDPQKNHAGFINAAQIIQRSVPGVHFVLAGDGIDQNNAELVAAVERAGLNEMVHMLGKRRDMPRLFASLDLLASASHGEGFPNVLGEAMSCGVPCVVTDVGESREIVGKTGRAVRAGDMLGLAEQIVSLLALTSEMRAELGRQARMRIAERYDIKEVTRLHETFYLRLMTRSQLENGRLSDR